MSTRLMTRIFPFTDQETWSPAAWRRHRLAKADRKNEREDLIAFFMD